jgi:hypothetical protein
MMLFRKRRHDTVSCARCVMLAKNRQPPSCSARLASRAQVDVPLTGRFFLLTYSPNSRSRMALDTASSANVRVVSAYSPWPTPCRPQPLLGGRPARPRSGPPRAPPPWKASRAR